MITFKRAALSDFKRQYSELEARGAGANTACARLFEPFSEYVEEKKKALFLGQLWKRFGAPDDSALYSEFYSYIIKAEQKGVSVYLEISQYGNITAVYGPSCYALAKKAAKELSRLLQNTIPADYEWQKDEIFYAAKNGIATAKKINE